MAQQNYVNAIKGNDTPEETVGGTTNNVNAINGDDTPEETETVGGTTIYVDANNGDDAQKRESVQPQRRRIGALARR